MTTVIWEQQRGQRVGLLSGAQLTDCCRAFLCASSISNVSSAIGGYVLVVMLSGGAEDTRTRGLAD